MAHETIAQKEASLADQVQHFTDGQSIEDLARRYPGSAESHIVIHRKLDSIKDMLVNVLQRLEAIPSKAE
jgi:hypothetical protein